LGVAVVIIAGHHRRHVVVEGSGMGWLLEVREVGQGRVVIIIIIRDGG
jgi:hypothetical protein